MTSHRVQCPLQNDTRWFHCREQAANIFRTRFDISTEAQFDMSPIIPTITSQSSRMDIFKTCISNIGFELIERRLTSNEDERIHNELFWAHRLSKIDKKKVFLFSDPVDVDLIRSHELGKDGIPKGADYLYIWDNKMYALEKNMNMTMEQWIIFFTKEKSSSCVVCFEEVVTEEEEHVAICPSCYEIRCRTCDINQKISECPVCRRFDRKSYMFKRFRYFNEVMKTSGVTREEMDTKNRGRCMHRVMLKFPHGSIDDVIDGIMEMKGEKVYDVDDDIYTTAWEAFM